MVTISAPSSQPATPARVLITGGNSGIGRAAAEALARQGARVAVLGRNPETLAETGRALGEQGLAIEGDVTRLTDLDRMVTTVEETFGGLDVLITSAGVAPILPVDQVTEAFFDEVVDVNLKGTYFTVQKCLPLLSDGGAIVLVGSSGAHKGVGGMSVYSASKAGVVALARSFSAELISRRIRVNVLSLGPIETPIFDRLGVPPDIATKLTESIRQQVPVQRFGETEEAVAALLFLASPASSYMVGADLRVDGGLSTL